MAVAETPYVVRNDVRAFAEIGRRRQKSPAQEYANPGFSSETFTVLLRTYVVRDDVPSECGHGLRGR
jgi:hypothetical protein